MALPAESQWDPESLPADVRQNLHAAKNVVLALIGLGSADGLTLVRPHS